MFGREKRKSGIGLQYAITNYSSKKGEFLLDFVKDLVIFISIIWEIVVKNFYKMANVDIKIKGRTDSINKIRQLTTIKNESRVSVMFFHDLLRKTHFLCNVSPGKYCDCWSVQNDSNCEFSRFLSSSTCRTSSEDRAKEKMRK